MLDREMLKDMGFELGKGWDHEVWVKDGYFWVHYTDEPTCVYLKSQIVSGYATRKEFFDVFLNYLENEYNAEVYRYE